VIFDWSREAALVIPHTFPDWKKKKQKTVSDLLLLPFLFLFE